MLYRLARRALDGDADVAEDVVQEAWVRAVDRLATFRGESTFRTWLAGYVIHIAREQRRVPPGGMERDLADDPAAQGAEDDRLRGTYARLDLERAIATLAPGFRQVLWLHDVEGFTHEEIAGSLGIATGTSKSQLARARAAMRRALSAGG